ALEGKPAHQNLVEHRLFERHDVDDELPGRADVGIGVLAGAAREGDVHRLVADARARPKGCGIDAALPIDGGDEDEAGGGRKNVVPPLGADIDLGGGTGGGAGENVGHATH